MGGTISEFRINAEQSPFDNNDAIEDEEVEVKLIANVEQKPHTPLDAAPSCEDLDYTMNIDRLEKFLESCDPGCRLVVPCAGEKCHSFNGLKPGRPVPKAVLSASYFKLGFSFPMHPLFIDILKFYDIAPMQLTPNSYRMTACMFILYNQTFSVPLTARELGYCYQLKDVGRKVSIFTLFLGTIAKVSV